MSAARPSRLPSGELSYTASTGEGVLNLVHSDPWPGDPPASRRGILRNPRWIKGDGMRGRTSTSRVAGPCRAYPWGVAESPPGSRWTSEF